jgi:Protein of unknown function (DUF2933)
MLKMCLNPKVLAGLAAVGVGIYLVAPDLVLAALPILLLAACPLSMLLMMWAMRGGPSEDQQASQEADAGLTREEHLTRLRWQQAALADRIDELEQDESQPARDGKRS